MPTGYCLKIPERKRAFGWRAMLFVVAGVASAQRQYTVCAFMSRFSHHTSLYGSKARFHPFFSLGIYQGILRSSCCCRHDVRMLSPRCQSLSSKGTHRRKQDFVGVTVQEALDTSLSFLQESDAPEPESSVTHLLADAMNLPWANGFVMLRNVMQSNSENELATQTLSQEEAELFQEMLYRRANKEPLQYILGRWDFLDCTFLIRPPLLCPRPETEELVLHVVDDVHELDQVIRILDVGCGTGAIGVSLVAMIPNGQVTAIDIEPIAIETSNENAKLILGNDGVARYQAILSTASDYANDKGPFDVIVSNPPYIPKRDMPTLSDDVAKYESQDALCGGEDGMDVIRCIIHQAPKWGKRGTIIWMEVDPTHPSMIQKWIDKEGSSLGVVFDYSRFDLYGRNRFVKLRVT